MFRTVLRRQARVLLQSKRDGSRLYSTEAASTHDIPVKAPHDKIPFAAKPEDSTRGDLGQVKMPDLTEYEVIDVPVPSEPDNYQARSTNLDEDYPRFHAPAQTVYTVSSPEGLPDGATSSSGSSAGPTISHGGGDDTLLAHVGDAISSLPRDADMSRAREPGAIMAMLNDVTGIEIGHGKGQVHEFHFEDRPLNGDESKGLYVLGGIVVGGYLLSRLLTDPPRKEKHPVE